MEFKRYLLERVPCNLHITQSAVKQRNRKILF